MDNFSWSVVTSSTWYTNANSAISAATPNQPDLQTVAPPGGLVQLDLYWTETEKLRSKATASLPDPAKFNLNPIWPNNKSNPIVKDSVKNSPHPEFWTSCLFRRSAFSYLPAYLKAKMRRRNLEAKAPPVYLTQPSSIPTRFDQTTNQIRSLRIQWKTHLIQRLELASNFFPTHFTFIYVPNFY